MSGVSNIMEEEYNVLCFIEVVPVKWRGHFRTLMPWNYGAKRNMPAQPTTGFNKPLTNSTSLFTLSPKKQARPIKIGTHTLKEEDQASYLGVTFDKRLTWKPHTLRRGKGTQEAGNHAQTSWNNMGR